METTQKRYKLVQFQTEICTKAGTPYPCTIWYDLEGLDVLEHGVKFDHGYYCFDYGYKYLSEIVADTIRKVEGTNQLDFQTDLNIED